MRHRKAILVATQALNNCITPDGIIAGTHHFVDLWARDSLFATFGSDAIFTKTTIETFLRFQRNDGFIPYRVMRSKTSIAKYFGKPTMLTQPKAEFRSHQSGGLVLDGGLMTIIAIAHSSRRSGSRRFFHSHYGQLERAIGWYEKRFPDRLLSEWFQCEWADGVLKSGSTLYTNVLYWKALGDMGNHSRQRRIGDLIRKQLWNGKFFADWADYKRQDYFSSHANMLQCVSGLADYQNQGCLWLQPGITYALALWVVGYKKEAREFLSNIAVQIVRYGGVYEVYEKKGTPVNRPLYRSESPFAWSSGLFLWASHILGKL